MDNQDFSLDQSEELTIPHFDDEETIQCARPVVPLHEVRKASLTKQRLLLGGALCVAAVVGALTASWISGPRDPQRVQESSSTTTNEQSSRMSDFVPSGEAGGATVDPNEAVALDSEAMESEPDGRMVERNQTSVPRSAIRSTPTPKKVEKVIPQASESDNQTVSSDEELFRERRRDARRLRRERRIEERRSEDGLTRIREIFEGPQRP